MRNISALVAIAAISLPLQAMASVVNTGHQDHENHNCGTQNCSGVSWADWAKDKKGTFTQDGETIKVTYSGHFVNNLHDAHIFNDVPDSFTAPGFPNTPGDNGTIMMTGGQNNKGNILGGKFEFDKPVVNPLMAIWSLGQPGYMAKFVFETSDFVILSQGAGHWGGGSLTKVGNTVEGYEGNGLIQFIGTFDEIKFQLPIYEYYYGATVGAACDSSGGPAEVPVPAALPLMATGLGLLGFGSARRVRKTA